MRSREFMVRLRISTYVHIYRYQYCLPGLRMRQPQFNGRQAVACRHTRINLAAFVRAPMFTCALLDGMDHAAVPGLARAIPLVLTDEMHHFMGHALVEEIACRLVK